MSTPLQGVRVLVTRARHQAAALTTALDAAGATILEVPLIEIMPPADFSDLDRRLRELHRYAWLVFTSANAVEATFDRAARIGVPISAAITKFQIAAIGTSTAAAVDKYGLRVEAMPEKPEAEDIAGVLGDLSGARVLLLQADIARDAARKSLAERGAEVDAVTAYRTVISAGAATTLREALASGADVITFMSASAVHAFLTLRGNSSIGQARIACIGDHTATAAREGGLDPHIIATTPTSAGLVDAIVQAIGNHS